MFIKFRSEKGFTGIDITVAIIVILLLMSIISILFFNITKSSKSIDRKSEATFLATTIIEDIKAQEYDNLAITNGFVNVKDYSYSNNNKVSAVTNNEIKDGYTTTLNVYTYVPDSVTDRTEVNDLVKVITVKVEYKLGNEVKNVELTTSIVREL